MNFLQKIFKDASTKPEKRYYTFSVKCRRCGEIIEGRVDLDNDLSVEYEAGRDLYHARKVLMGNDKCFQSIEVDLIFDARRDLVDRQASGGEFV